MTRPAKSSLVLDGGEVKLRLIAERIAAKTSVHVDWVRFTVLLRNAPVPDGSIGFVNDSIPCWDEKYRAMQLSKLLADLPDEDYAPATQAFELANEVAGALGVDFKVATEIRKGHDFYRCRWPIERNGQECGWVGFLASSESPAQQAQARTMHANIYGAACTFAEPGWNLRMAALIDARDGDMTRCDLALDFFDGIEGGLDSWVAEYKSGACDSGGKRLKSNCVGDWLNGQSRSFYMGSREAGKQTNCYEKGDQLFGVEAGSTWLRIEVRYGNKLRVLSSDMLRRPSDFFAGSSDWHAFQLARADAMIEPEKIKTEGRLALETVEAEVTRNVRWMMTTAAPSLASAFLYLDFDEFREIIQTTKLPGRLQKFSPKELGAAFSKAFNRVSTGAGTGPAFA